MILRFGVYDITKDVLGDTPENPLPLYLKVPASLFAGAVGATIGNPGDLCMVRMQADGKLPPELRRGYGNVFNAMYLSYLLFTETCQSGHCSPVLGLISP